MNKFPLLLALACGAISNGINADERLGKGKLLVATEAVQGPAFAESVVLILNYSTAGAEGLVVNRPTEVPPVQALPELAGLDRYEGTLYWGGPVEPFTLRALLHSDAPPDNAMPIFDTVHLAPLNENLFDGASSDENLRFFAGYAGWAPGQLEHELELGSWHIVAATDALVFTDDPGAIWRRLSPPIRAQGPGRQDKNNPLQQPTTRMSAFGQMRTWWTNSKPAHQAANSPSKEAW